MSQQAALLQAILDDPDDDAVRLVFADWCEENGQAERAEFVRLQIERGFKDHYEEKMPPREKAQLERHASEWFDPPAGWKPCQHYKVQRGFPWTVHCAPGDAR